MMLDLLTNATVVSDENIITTNKVFNTYYFQGFAI